MTSPEPSDPPARLHELDALRGIAALMVVLFHYTTMFGEKWGHGFDVPGAFALGQHGVKLFFIVSGFVIYMSLQRRPTPGSFAVSRFARLAPSYWAAVLLTFIVLAAFGLPDETIGELTYNFSVADALANLTLLHWAIGIPHIDGVYWTLVVELAFYSVMLLLLRCGWLNQPRRASTALVAVGCGVVIVLAALSAVPGAEAAGTGIAIYAFLFAAFANLFLAGIVFYRLRDGVTRPLVMTLLLTLLVEAVLRPDSFLLIVSFYVLFALLIRGGLRPIAVRPLLWLGAVSYPLYLIHQRVGYVVIHRLEGASIDNPIVLVAVPLLIALAAATVIHLAVELPAQRVLRARLQRRQPSPASQRLLELSAAMRGPDVAAPAPAADPPIGAGRVVAAT